VVPTIATIDYCTFPWLGSRAFLRGDEAGSNLYPLGTQGQGCLVAPRVGNASSGDHRDAYMVCHEGPSTMVVDSGLAVRRPPDSNPEATAPDEMIGNCFFEP